jgi:hypothetical protein
MGMKISVGLQKKVGQPNFGSAGASYHVEFEVDPGLIEINLEAFYGKVNSAFLACRQAVNAQLRQQEGNQPEMAPASTHKPQPYRQAGSSPGTTAWRHSDG